MTIPQRRLGGNGSKHGRGDGERLIARKKCGSVEDRPPKPNYQCMEELIQEQINLYKAETPPGAPIPINVDPFDESNKIPTDSVIRDAVKCLWNGQAQGLGGMRTEHLKTWLRSIKEEETEDKPLFFFKVDSGLVKLVMADLFSPYIYKGPDRGIPLHLYLSPQSCST